MNNNKNRIFSVLVLALLFSSFAFAQPDDVRYQGSLNTSGQPANGNFDFEFVLYGQLTGGAQVASTITRTNVPVVNGVFSASFGLAGLVSGGDRFLEIRVRQAGVGSYVTLTPRQQLTSTPYSLLSREALTANRAFEADSAAVATNATNATNAQNAVQANTATTATNVSGVVGIANGGTGSSTKNFVDTSTNQTNIGGDKTFSGILTGNGSGLTNVPGTVLWQTVAGVSTSAVSNRGYVVTSPQLSTITLPANPAIGDLIRVTGASLGGWKISTNAGQEIFTQGVVPLGRWIPRGPKRNWVSVASSVDGVKLVAAAVFGQIHTSIDSGMNWIPRDAIRAWLSVASSADGTKLVAVVSSGQIYTSTDSGVSWTPRDSARSWQSVASSSDGSKLVAVVSGGQIYTSTDSGVSWTPRDSNRGWSSVASSGDGTKLVATVQGGQIYTSTDSGLSWEPRDSSRNWISVASSSDGTKLLAGVLGDRVYVSSNSGITWTPSVSAIGSWTGLASSLNGTNVASVDRNGIVYTSTNSGASWIPAETVRDWRGIASSGDGSKLVAITGSVSGGSTNATGRIYIRPGTISTNTAKFLEGAQESTIELQYIGNGQFLLLSGFGDISAY